MKILKTSALLGFLALLAQFFVLPAEATTSGGVSLEAAYSQSLSVGSEDEWIDTDSLFEGTQARIVVNVRNTSTTANKTLVVIRADGLILGSKTMKVTRGESEIVIPLKIDGASWSDVGVAAPQGISVSVAGIEGSGITTNSTISPRPVVLLHGLWSNAGTWSAYEGFVQNINPLWHSYAVGDGQFTGAMDTGALLSPTRRPNSVDANAAQAWTYINDLRTGLNANQIDVVAHSMGGIIIRRVLHAYGKDAQQAVRDVVMLGTPNGGSKCASTWSVPATQPLLPSVMKQFNLDNPGYPGVNSTLVFAEHLAPTCLDFSWGDTVVPRWSAKTVDVDRLYKGEATLHSNMTKDKNYFNSYVIPALAHQKGGEEPPSNVSGNGSGKEPAGANTIQLASEGAFEANQVVDIPIVLNEGEQLYVSVITGNDADLEIVGIGGESIKLVKTNPDMPVYVANTGTADKAGKAYLRGSSSSRAEWSFTIVGSESSLTLKLESENGRIHLDANLQDSNGVTVQSVKAEITDENGDDSYSVTLNDDGVYGDWRRDDLRFSGTVSGRDFERDEDVQVIVTATYADGTTRTVIAGLDEINF
jgi:pimeloyl-ACP methyl ester carboxylesterase